MIDKSLNKQRTENNRLETHLVDPLSEQKPRTRVWCARGANVHSSRDRITLQLDVVRHKHMGQQTFQLVGSKESSGAIDNMQSVSIEEKNKATYHACLPCPKLR